MHVEIVAIGTELLLGQITDTNSSWIGEQLALIGVDSYYQTTVGDNLDRIVGVLTAALDRSDAVICTGGLGPTQDDLTRSALAQVMGVRLEPDEKMEETIMERFASRGARMPMNNLRQAELPVGAKFMGQMPGTAPGLIAPIEWNGEHKVIYAMPGVPWEMKEMFLSSLVPDLEARSDRTGQLRSRMVRVWGISESGLAEQLAPRLRHLDEVGNPTLAFLASGADGIAVRVTAKGDTEDEVSATLDAEEQELRSILGPLVYGVDDQTMESQVVELLKARGFTLGTAESVTGGLMASRLVEVAGVSGVYRGSIVSYASDVKFGLLNVPEGPVVNEQTAIAMALGAQERLGVNVALATTGVAGPEWAEGVAPGTVCVAIAIGDVENGGIVDSTTLQLPGKRRQIREYAVISVLGLLRRLLLALPENE